MFVPSSDLPQYSCLRLHLICRACFHCRLVFTRFFERCTSRFWHACDINPAPACLSTSSPPTLLHPTPFHLAGIYTIFLRVITAVTSLKLRYTSHPSHSLQPTVESYLPWNTPCWQLDFRINTSSPSLTSWVVASVNEVCLWNLSSTAKINLSSTTKMKNKTLSQLFFICWPEIGARSRDNLIKQYLWLICHFSSEHCKCQ